ncbi:MAG: hypothetical protein NTV94_12495 [Planctomycetota bacterium]|nr:hypothetical protein [Planctomycetota bacterium]
MRRSRRECGMCLVLAGAACLGGCYERVVSANGIGASTASVQDSYRSNTAADRAIDSVVSKPKPSSRAQRWVDPGSRNPGGK